MKLFWKANSSNPIYCHFCQPQTLVDPNTLICPDCGQYNGFDDTQPSDYYSQTGKDSSYTTPKRFCVPLKEHNQQQSYLCRDCYHKQELWRKAIANIDSCHDDADYLQDNDMQLTTHEKRELERIQQTYGLCRFCEGIVRQRVSWIDQKLSSNRLNFYMARSSFVQQTTDAFKENQHKSCPFTRQVCIYLMGICFLCLCVGYIFFCDVIYSKLPSRFYSGIAFCFRLLLNNILWIISKQELGMIILWIIRFTLIYSIYKSIRSNLLYPYLFCYCIVSSFLVCGKWLSLNNWLVWIYKGWIGGLYLLSRQKKTNTRGINNALEREDCPTILSAYGHVNNRLYPLPRAISTLSLEDDYLSSIEHNRYMVDDDHDQTSPINRVYRDYPYPRMLLSLYETWKNYMFQYQMGALIVLFFVIRILRLIYLKYYFIQVSLSITSWVIVFFIWLYPFAQWKHCYQQIVYQASYHPFDSRLYQQWKHPLRNQFFFCLLQCGILAYFMVTMVGRDISPWVEMTLSSLNIFFIHEYTFFKRLFCAMFQEYGILIGFVVAMWMSSAYRNGASVLAPKRGKSGDARAIERNG